VAARLATLALIRASWSDAGRAGAAAGAGEGSAASGPLARAAALPAACCCCEAALGGPPPCAPPGRGDIWPPPPCWWCLVPDAIVAADLRAACNQEVGTGACWCLVPGACARRACAPRACVQAPGPPPRQQLASAPGVLLPLLRLLVRAGIALHRPPQTSVIAACQSPLQAARRASAAARAAGAARCMSRRSRNGTGERTDGADQASSSEIAVSGLRLRLVTCDIEKTLRAFRGRSQPE
jgi:hypothetical protein